MIVEGRGANKSESTST